MNVLRIVRGLDEAVGLGRAMREKEARDEQERKRPKSGRPESRQQDGVDE
jgi:hypothetical protein